MKIRILKLTPEFLVELLQGKTSSFSSNLPSDVEMLDIRLDLFSRQVQVMVRSESFEDVAESYPIPELKLTSTKEAKPVVKSVATAKSGVKPETKLVATKQPQSGTAQISTENEFSPEQRRLLSFTVKGDFVVVKPIQFLKAEWDDINEVVRSSGGKWVKGDIISYWEIPLKQG